MQTTKIKSGLSLRGFWQIELSLFESLAPNGIVVTFPTENLDQLAPPADENKIVPGGRCLPQKIDGGSRQSVERFTHVLRLMANIDFGGGWQ